MTYLFSKVNQVIDLVGTMGEKHLDIRSLYP
jgi:citrate synthase